MTTIVTILHVIVCVFLIFVVLLQACKGGGMRLAFGGSNAGQVFGGSGAGNFLTRLTAITAVLFMLTSLTLAYLASARGTNWLTDYEKKTEAQAKREAALKQQVGTTPAEGKAEEKTEAPAAPEGEPAKSEAPKTEEKAPAETSTPEKTEEKAPPKTEEKAPETK